MSWNFWTKEIKRKSKTINYGLTLNHLEITFGTFKNTNIWPCHRSNETESLFWGNLSHGEVWKPLSWKLPKRKNSSLKRIRSQISKFLNSRTVNKNLMAQCLLKEDVLGFRILNKSLFHENWELSLLSLFRGLGLF